MLPTSWHLHQLLHANGVDSKSQSQSQPSEPPDIRNWFPSYVYEESPDLNSSDLDGSCIEADKKAKSGTGEIQISGQVEEGVEEEPSNECEYTNSAALPLDARDVRPKTKSSFLQDQFTSKYMLPHETVSNNPASLTKFRPSIYDVDDDKKLEYGLIDTTKDNALHGKHNNKYNWNGRASHDKSISNEESLDKENIYVVASPGTLGLTMRKGDCWRGPVEFANENDGFISTRKRPREATNYTGNVRPNGKGGLQLLSNCERAASKSRKVLSDKSDVLLENTGKWHCPQKSKPNLGPPLKQLRLEHWVRRV